MIKTFIGIGSNLGDRLENLKRAIQLVGLIPDSTVLGVSSVYQTEPVGYRDQPDFLNGVAKIKTDLDPFALLSLLQKVEKQIGRQRRQRWGPREIDVDLLAMEGIYVNSPFLSVPHPYLLKRKFVLVPFAEIEPDFVVFGANCSVQDVLESSNIQDSIVYYSSSDALLKNPERFDCA